MSLRKTPKTERVSREEIILALSQARASAQKFVAGYTEGIGVAIELLRAVEDIERAILREDYERR